jgi:hypothetical protein
VSLNNIKKPTIKNFTFDRRPIFKEPQEVVRNAKPGYGKQKEDSPHSDSSFKYSPSASPRAKIGIKGRKRKSFGMPGSSPKFHKVKKLNKISSPNVPTKILE